MRKIVRCPEAVEQACATSRTNAEVGKKLGVSKATVTRLCRRMGIKIPQERMKVCKGGRRERPIRSLQDKIDAYYDEFDQNNITRTRTTKFTKEEKHLLALHKAATQPPMKRFSPADYERIKAKEEQREQDAKIQKNRESHELSKNVENENRDEEQT